MYIQYIRILKRNGAFIHNYSKHLDLSKNVQTIHLVFFSKTQGSGQNREGNDGDQPTEKSYDETEAHVVGLNLFHLSILDDQKCSKGSNTYHDN